MKHPGKDGAINLVKRIYLQDNGIEAGDLTSVTVHPSGDYVAVSAPAVIRRSQDMLYSTVQMVITSIM